MTRVDIRTSILVALGILGAVWGVFSGGWDAHLSAIYFAAYSYATGQTDLIYLSEPVFFGSSASRQWEAMAGAMGHTGVPVLPYIYEPIAVAVTPVSFFNVVLMIHAVACIGSMGLAWRIVQPRAMGLGVWMLISAAIVILTTSFFMGFWLNQPQFLVTFLILLAFERAFSGRPVTAGIVLGFAAALKITPAIFVFVFLINRNWSAALAAVVSGCAVLSLSIAIAGVDLHIAFAEQLQRAGSYLVLTPINFSFEGILTHLTQPDLVSLNEARDGATFMVVGTVAWIGMASKIGLIVSIALLWFVSRKVPPGDALFGQVLVIWCSIIFFGPLGWSHYLIGPLTLLPAAFSTLSRSWAITIVCLCAAAVSHLMQTVLAAVGTSMTGPMLLGALSLAGMSIMGVVAVARARV